MIFFSLRTILENPLNKNTYQKKFSMLMNIEELQMEVDIRRYDMKDAPMTKQRNLLLLEVRVICTMFIPSTLQTNFKIYSCTCILSYFN